MGQQTGSRTCVQQLGLHCILYCASLLGEIAVLRDHLLRVLPPGAHDEEIETMTRSYRETGG